MVCIGYLLQKASSPRLGNIINLPDTRKYKQQLRQNEATEEHVPDEGKRMPKEELSQVKIGNLPEKEFIQGNDHKADQS